MTARRRRRRGTRRVPRGRLLLTDRDEEVLRFVGRAGVTELPTVAALFWGRTSAARTLAARRVRILTDHGLLETGALALHRPNRLTLPVLGAERVVARDGEVFRTRMRPFSPAAEHLIVSAAVWAALLERVRGSSLRLQRYFTEAELRRAIGRVPGSLIPDGLAVVHGTGGAVGLAIECDLATEVAGVFGRKAARYGNVVGRPGVFHGLNVDAVLVFAPGMARLRQLARASSATSAASRLLFQDLARLSAATVLSDLASTESLTTGSDVADSFGLSLIGGAA